MSVTLNAFQMVLPKSNAAPVAIKVKKGMVLDSRGRAIVPLGPRKMQGLGSLSSNLTKEENLNRRMICERILQAQSLRGSNGKNRLKTKRLDG